MDMIVTKEKNLVRFVNGKEERTFDLNSGRVYSKAGREVTGAFFDREGYNVPIEMKDYFYLAKGYSCLGWGIEALKFFNTLFSLYPTAVSREGLYAINYYKRCFPYIKLLGKYKLSIDGRQYFSPKEFYAFALRNENPRLEHYTSEVLFALGSAFERNEGYEDIIFYYFPKTYSFFENSPSAILKIENYLSFCKFIKKEPIKTSNFMREYIETKKEYICQKTAYDKKLFNEIYKEKTNVFEFTYGDYTVTVPKEPNDLIVEGRLMHHCVGSYVQNVIKKECYIVFIRNKNNMEKPYITCQVMPDGSIKQYYLAYDNLISLNEDKVFKAAFQKHLYENWG